jgi:hypothetical protein
MRRSTAILELSPAAYDEIERKLLGGGYEHLFLHGPGSPIEMEGLMVTRAEQKNSEFNKSWVRELDEHAG